MAKDLTTSKIDRQNILNNPVALPKIRESLDVDFVQFQGQYVITRQKAAEYYGVDIRTLTNCLSHYEQELVSNGYRVLQGEALKEFKSALGKEIDFPTKTTVLGVFDFRSFLNLGMLLTTSEKAKEVRSHILVSSGIWSDAFRRQPLQSIQCISKCFTNGRLRIDFFQSSSLLVVNNAIMGYFDKSLNINTLYL